MPPSSHALDSAHESTLREQLASLRFLTPYLWRADRPGFKLRIVASVVVILLGQIATVLAPFLLAEAINGLDAEAALVATAFALTVGYGALRLVSSALPQLREFLFSVVGQTAQRDVATDVFRHLHTLSLRFHLERRTGGLSRMIERGIRSIDFLFRFLLFNIGPTIILLLIVCVTFAVRYDWRLSAIAAATVVLYFWFTAASTEWRLKFRREMNRKDQLANTRAVDALLNYETVKYFGNERYEAGRYDHALADYQDAAVRSQNSLAVVNIGQSLIINVGLVAALALTIQGVVAGNLGIGEVTAVSLVMMQLYQPLNILGFAYREIKQSLVDMEKMFDLLHVEPEVADREDARPLQVRGAEVRFEDVRFRYDADRAILKGVSFTARPGEKLAIVGPSGAGKSTIARILYRFYDLRAGRVLIDGQDIGEVTQESLRAAIGMVPQDTVLFNDTIGYNIRYARPEASQEEIERAARLAQVHDFISSLPKGYDTLVGERGLKLSGGEKQRVAIARTILKDPPLLILDEATSALDSATEAGILSALREVASGRTTLVIAHRLSTIVDADRIVVLREGEVVEEGSHDELLAKGGLYADLWRQQSEVPATGETAMEAAE
jgi:ATP-binding cassette subfamily B protein